MTAAFILMFPPVQSTVPPFSKVRVVRLTALALARLRVTPAGMIVRPLPLIVPPVQFITPRTVTTWLPLKVPPLKFRMAGVTVPVPLKLAVPLEMASVLLVQM